MLERLARKGPASVPSTLSAPIEDLEWAAAEVSTALTLLQESGPKQ
jgi:hypothetical protein